jgi:hypothetical protein
MPCPPHPPSLDHSNYTWRRVQVMKLLIMQLSPNLMSIFFSFCRLSRGIRPGLRLLQNFCNKFIFYSEELLAQLQSWRTTPCQLSATAYSIYLQLPSKTGGCLLHPQPEDAPCRVDRDPLNMGLHTLHYVNAEISVNYFEGFHLHALGVIFSSENTGRNGRASRQNQVH